MLYLIDFIVSVVVLKDIDECWGFLLIFCWCRDSLRCCVSLLYVWRIAILVLYLCFLLSRNWSIVCIEKALFLLFVILRVVLRICGSSWWRDFHNLSGLFPKISWTIRLTGWGRPRLFRWERGLSSRSFFRGRSMPFRFLNYQIWLLSLIHRII